MNTEISFYTLKNSLRIRRRAQMFSAEQRVADLMEELSSLSRLA